MNSSEAREGAEAASNAGAIAEKVTSAADPSRSAIGRVGATAAAMRLATRLVPATWRFVKRYPGVSSMLLVTVVGVAYLARPAGMSTRH